MWGRAMARATPGGTLPSAANTGLRSRTPGPARREDKDLEGEAGASSNAPQLSPASSPHCPRLWTASPRPRHSLSQTLPPTPKSPPPPTSQPCRHQACRFPPQQDPVHWPQRPKRRRGWGVPLGKFPRAHRGDSCCCHVQTQGGAQKCLNQSHVHMSKSE